ncbi:MAG: hypothetical protein V4760_14765 [Bdellovibrionota bacterium]
MRLRSAFPDAGLDVEQDRLVLRLTTPSPRTIEFSSTPVPTAGHEPYQVIQASLRFRFDALDEIPVQDFLRLIAAENAGLRGVTVVSDEIEGRRAIRVRASFLGVRGRTKDEAENVLIDVLSLVRFSRLLEDRILRSTAAGLFCVEMYHSQYLSKTGGRNRYVNYARSVFQGSPDRILGEVTRVLKDDHGFDVRSNGVTQMTLTTDDRDIEINVRVPEEIPMMVFSARLPVAPMDQRKAHALADKLNRAMIVGHFEVVTTTGGSRNCAIAFSAWKHMTNDLRLYAVDHLVATLLQSAEMVRADEPTRALAPNWSDASARRAA